MATGQQLESIDVELTKAFSAPDEQVMVWQNGFGMLMAGVVSKKFDGLDTPLRRSAVRAELSNENWRNLSKVWCLTPVEFKQMVAFRVFEPYDTMGKEG
jgi:hypothetical protein